MPETITSAPLQLEGLESREVPAVQIFATGHTLHIWGDGHANTINIQDNGHGGFTVDAGTDHFSVSGIDKVVIDTKGSGDKVNYQLTGKLTTTETVKAWLGAGSDKATFNFSDGVASDGHLTLVLHDVAGTTRDNITIGSVAKGGSAVVHEYDGRGHDRVNFHATGEVGGRLAVTLRDGSGPDVDHVVDHEKIVGHGEVTIGEE